MPPLLELQGLTKRYKGGRGAFDISLSLEPGEVLGLLGPNGSGKTSVMKTICTLVHPTSGDVRIAGFDPFEKPVKALSLVGALIETPALFYNFSARQNMLMAARYHPGVTRENVGEALACVGLAAFADMKTGTFSLGMKQRLGLALAMLHRPKLFILDEPANGLDIEGMVAIRQIVAFLRGNGAAFLISSHLAAELELECTRVAVMNEGRIISTSSMEDVTLRYQNLETYFLACLQAARTGVGAS